MDISRTKTSAGRNQKPSNFRRLKLRHDHVEDSTSPHEFPSYLTDISRRNERSQRPLGTIGVYISRANGRILCNLSGEAEILSSV
jgi:hypothetical protein